MMLTFGCEPTITVFLIVWGTILIKYLHNVILKFYYREIKAISSFLLYPQYCFLHSMRVNQILSIPSMLF